MAVWVNPKETAYATVQLESRKVFHIEHLTVFYEVVTLLGAVTTSSANTP